MEVKALSCGPPAALSGEGRAASVDPDAELVAAAQADPTRFVALYDRYVPRVHGYVRVRIRDAATCEDVTSQVFTTALAKLARFRGGGSFGAWLFRIAQNAVHDVYRRQRVDALPGEALDALCDGAPGPEEQALAGDRARRLRALLATLAPEQQHLLALRYGAGLSFEEIGRVVGKTTGAARVSTHRILQDLRRRYPYDE